MEQRIFDLMVLAGGEMKAHDIKRALCLTKDQCSACGWRLYKRGLVRRMGATWHSLWVLTSTDRPADGRGVSAGSKSAYYGTNGKIVQRGNDYRRRGKNKVTVDPTVLWHVWQPFPKLQTMENPVPIIGGTVRPQET